VITTTDSQVTVRTLAYLRSFRSEAGLPTTFRVDVPADGLSAGALAGYIGLPADMVEGVFHNYVKSGLDSLVVPGDRVAFVPYGTPASHPAFFGPFGDDPA
jgi:hypothetical protein